MTSKKILLKRSNEVGKLPQPNNLVYGELSMNYARGSESISFKNAANEIVTFGTKIKEGINSVTTLTNVPVDKRLVYATLTKDENLSFDTSRYASCFNAFDKGAQIKIIAFNGTTSTHKIVLPFTNIDYVCFVKSIEVPVNGYGIITVDYDGTSIYVNAKVEERVDGYAGGEAIVALSNSEGDIKYVTNKNLQAFKNNTENNQYVPIGIVVIPKSHTQVILPDGDPRKGCNIIMSLKEMDYNTPEEGGSREQWIEWGDDTKDIQELTNYTVVNCYEDTTQDSSTLTTNGTAYLPSDRFDALPSNVCPSIKYDYTPLAPSPYKVVDGEWLPNEDYYTTRVSTFNALSDFEGPKNTKIITDNVTVENWKTVKPIVNSHSAGNYPAACCCARFKTTGTHSFVDMLNLNTESDTEEYWKQTKVWYMPACGELGYIMPNFNVNNMALNNINNLYGSSVAVQLDSRFTWWSSSEEKSDCAWLVNAGYGHVNNPYKKLGYPVRAFCALPA